MMLYKNQISINGSMSLNMWSFVLIIAPLSQNMLIFSYILRAELLVVNDKFEAWQWSAWIPKRLIKSQLKSN